MSEYVTKKDLEEVMKSQMEDIGGLFQTFMGQVDERFNAVDERFNAVDERFNAVEDKIAAHEVKSEARFTRIEEKLNKLSTDMNSVMNRLDSIEKGIELNDDERQVMGMQLNRIHDWVEKAAQKIGVDFAH